MNNIVIAIAQINSTINHLVWGPVMITVLLGTGFYFTVRTGFLQIFKFRSVISETIIQPLLCHVSKKDKGGISPFQALSTALAGTIGTGNIAGVATAITIAGPGAIFWMWVSAFLGMMTKYAEVTLAIKYRKRNTRGEWIGGPMIFIEKGLHMKWLASLYAVFGVAASFGVGNMAQSNSISSAMHAAFHVSPLLTGIALASLVGISVIGGVKKIAMITEKVVPAMSVFYILGALIVIIVNFSGIPHAVAIIFSGAFHPSAPIGGFAGATVATAIQKGIARGVFTNEAGLGSASIAHAAANTDHPARQGLWGVFEVFFDTIVMCSITAFAIMVSGAWTNGQSGSALTAFAFDTAMPHFGKYIVAISLIFFAFSSILAWSFYGGKCIEYLAGARYIKYYTLLFLSVIVFGAISELHLVWDISDTLNGLMAIPNLIGLLGLSEVVIRTTKEGFRQLNL